LGLSQLRIDFFLVDLVQVKRRPEFRTAGGITGGNLGKGRLWSTMRLKEFGERIIILFHEN
jgi:hypothetical protein